MQVDDPIAGHTRTGIDTEYPDHMPPVVRAGTQVPLDRYCNWLITSSEKSALL